MKKLLFILLLIAVAVPFSAQIKTLPREIKLPKREILSRTTGQRGYSNVKISVELTNTEGMGETLKFSSNVNIAKVEISAVDVPNSKQTTIYDGNTKDGFFYLQSGAYKSGQAKGYLFHFFVKDFDKAVWVCVLTEKK
jgi:hypothetical protein